MKHTPGPWTVGEAIETEYRQPFHAAVIQETPEGRMGCVIATTGPAGDQRSIADARLMSAAPELLDALDGMLTLWGRIQAEMNWKDSPLSADTLSMMISAPVKAQQAIEKAEAAS